LEKRFRPFLKKKRKKSILLPSIYRKQQTAANKEILKKAGKQGYEKHFSIISHKRNQHVHSGHDN